jgi:peptide/nickel transport system permease protein
MSIGQLALRRSAGSRKSAKKFGWLGWAAVCVLSTFAFFGVFGAAVAPHDPNKIDLAYAYVGPIPGHLLGFDELGRDLFSRLLVGAQSSLLGPFMLVFFATLAGTTLAVVAAWRRGWVDALLSTGVDIAIAFPGILLAIILVTIFGASLPVAVLALTLAYTPGLARLLRTSATRETGMEYIKALKVLGFSDSRIIFRHLLPNLAPHIFAQAIVMFGYAVLDIGALSFLGLGVQAPTSDWGSMVAAGASGLLQGYPTQTIAAGSCLVLTAVSFAIIGERLARVWGVE